MISASAPSTTMLFGEHAVLTGGKALVAALNARVTVCLEPIESERIEIVSSLGRHVQALADSALTAPFEFVLAAVQAFKPAKGLRLTIESEVSSTLGLGSSAAVTVATVACLYQWLHGQENISEQFKLAYHAVLSVQGLGSGADIYAATFGGVQSYCIGQTTANPVNWPWRFYLCYCGYKTPTKVVLAMVERRRLNDAESVSRSIACINQATELALLAAKHHSLDELSEACKLHQAAMKDLGLSTPELEQLITSPAAKISGSGLGDCVITFVGSDTVIPEDMIKLSVSNQGVCLHESA
ncbi:MAG: hypothetical protein COV52_06355 [Gammaproteobacteria bacterium CG11_big_fil_rev_8_21_14_0_20_46_22]|nr:MAG: hypothetical protein COW05_07305 [Gammaproteobacteria bacterium CG12_big_fil_rev_8_21_14_0_65_46_12]PIR11123.1 MAG: hypothetical protein COV52_06355 [Gammaproteobacteria bacterium CG11_big_fil_rev_8_21_14_0_20_46_22]